MCYPSLSSTKPIFFRTAIRPSIEVQHICDSPVAVNWELNCVGTLMVLSIVAGFTWTISKKCSNERSFNQALIFLSVLCWRSQTELHRLKDKPAYNMIWPECFYYRSTPILYQNIKPTISNLPDGTPYNQTLSAD